ncbi:amidase [Streptococcus pseudoporcinus]|uniref:Amidase n=1 Tax=Streptococcus pseudoporcinus LQ 940-04 TaxID=875093 RepID=G5KAH4_9STRE|nr:amidase [Streptococcus pseudoporcinus]EFR44591.1 Amidase [Streptococcus pseudoporcinus SPIN 20026]EHI65574.1 amidase [Streptococcus pseudoporcinus LQ 940-04]VEF93056.1 amidase [Streptococcus pseudoporcinus]
MKTFKDATEMAHAVRTHRVTPLELVEETIAQANKHNPNLNAIVSRRYEEAREEARTRDFSNLPFAGVPIFIKDLGQSLTGSLATSGSVLFQKNYARVTSRYVQKLQDLGFIILGTTNVPEFGFKNISDSKANGAVNLPFDLSRNAGGSSGGAAALMTSGITVISAASDGGGSIRIPASFNGLIGLKPSRGRIPTGPDSYRGWQGASVHFALTKSVRDTKTFLFHMQECQFEGPFPLPLLSEDALFNTKTSSLTIAILSKEVDGRPFSDEVNRALEETANFLEKKGHTITWLASLPLDMDALIDSYYFMNAAETAAMFDDIKQALGRSLTKNDMETMTWAIYQAGQNLKAKDYSKVISEWDLYSACMARFHKEYDLLITPTTHDIAPKHGQLDSDSDLMAKLAQAESYTSKEQLQLVKEMFKKGLALNPYTPLANLTGQPAITLPLSLVNHNYPLGIQFMAAKGREDLLLQVASLFEEAGRFKMKI